MLVIGSIIGAGVFFTPTDIAAVTQDRGSMTWVWFIGGLIALTGALTYAELGGMFSRAGGVYVFLREAFGDLPAFLYGWGLILVIAPGAAAIVAGVFSANLAYFLPGLGASGQRCFVGQFSGSRVVALNAPERGDVRPHQPERARTLCQSPSLPIRLIGH